MTERKFANTEVVGRFARRETFKSAVEALLAAGFERSDLSVLDNHESLSAAESGDATWKATLAGLTGEVKYVGPLTAAGIIMLSTGPIGVAIAAAVAAGVGSMALAELLTEVRATPRAREFARALEGGAVLLWVRADTAERQRVATEILLARGGADVHAHERGA